MLRLQPSSGKLHEQKQIHFLTVTHSTVKELGVMIPVRNFCLHSTPPTLGLTVLLYVLS